jgi:DNA helicase-2/ATP-dependent DNA helicase PcrA
LYADGDVRAPDIAQLQQIAAGYASREKFLTELTLDPPDATSGHARATQLDEDYTILSTIHSAKGREWGSCASVKRRGRLYPLGHGNSNCRRD